MLIREVNEFKNQFISCHNKIIQLIFLYIRTEPSYATSLQHALNISKVTAIKVIPNLLQRILLVGSGSD